MGFVKVCRLDKIPADDALAVEIGDTPIPWSAAAACTRSAPSPMTRSPGMRSTDTTVECWLQGSGCGLRTGEPTNPPAPKPIDTYEVRGEDDEVYVAFPTEDRGCP